MKAITVANGAYNTFVPGSFVTWSAQVPTDTSTLSGDNVLCVIGTSNGGAPLQPYFITRSVDADGILQGGVLNDATAIAFNTSDSNGRRPSAVVAVNVQGGTQATFPLLDSAAGVVGTLTTLTYREPANQTKITLSGNQASGYTVAMTDSSTGAALGANRIGLGLYVQYVGAGKTSTVQVISTAGTLYLKTIVTGAGAGDSFQMPLTGLTVGQLADKVTASGPYNVLLARDSRLPAVGLDVMTTAASIQGYSPLGDTSVDALAGAVALTFAATGTSRAIAAGEVFQAKIAGVSVPVRVNVAALSGALALTVDPLSRPIPSGSTLFETRANAQLALSATQADLQLFFQTQAAALVTYAPGASVLPPAGQTGFFSGGVTLPASIGDWGAALANALAEFPFAQVVAMQEDRGVAYGLRAQLQERRTVQFSRPTRFFDAMPFSRVPQTSTLADVNAYFTDVANEVSSINDRDTSFVCQTMDSVTPSDGLLKRRAPMYSALQAASLRAAVGPNGTTTYATLQGSNPFPDLFTARDKFVKAGALVLDAPVRSGPARIVLGRTAYVGADNPVYESEKQVSVMNAVTRGLRDLQDSVVPGPNTKVRLAIFDEALKVFLQNLVTREWIQPGVDASGNPVSAFEYKISRTTDQGRRIPIKTFVNPVGEFLVADHEVIARIVEIEV